MGVLLSAACSMNSWDTKDFLVFLVFSVVN